ncbi:MAG: hypothetical protein ACI915_003552 [Gammaproteobacteria bacterium]|jgi:hypothetical protein
MAEPAREIDAKFECENRLFQFRLGDAYFGVTKPHQESSGRKAVE